MDDKINQLCALQKRIREATGPDRLLDAYVQQELIGKGTYPHPIPHYTTYPDGLGACVGLMHATLPGKNAHIFLGKWTRGTITREEGSGKTLHEMNDATAERPDSNLCLTFLDAIISARIAELEAEQKERVE